MINGVLDPNAGSYSVNDWEKVIDKLMAGPHAANTFNRVTVLNNNTLTYF